MRLAASLLIFVFVLNSLSRGVKGVPDEGDSHDPAIHVKWVVAHLPDGNARTAYHVRLLMDAKVINEAEVQATRGCECNFAIRVPAGAHVVTAEIVNGAKCSLAVSESFSSLVLTISDDQLTYQVYGS